MKEITPKPVSVIGGKEIAQWDLAWQFVPGGFAVPHPELRGKAGLYRAIENGQTVAIGMASEKNGGRLSKRLSDFTRSSPSARGHRVGAFINAHKDTLELQVLITGTDLEACSLAKDLRRAMIDLHRPRENVPRSIIQKAVYG